MDIILSSSGGKPIYEQITSQIKGMIMSGQLKAGDALPSMRMLAKSLHISVITAQHAYEDLQRDGFIETIPGKALSSLPGTKTLLEKNSCGLRKKSSKKLPG